MARGLGRPLVCVAVHSHNSRTCRFSCKGFLCQEEEDAVYVLYTFAQSLDLLRIVSPRNRCDAACAAREALARTLSNHIGRMADTLRPDPRHMVSNVILDIGHFINLTTLELSGVR